MKLKIPSIAKNVTILRTDELNPVINPVLIDRRGLVKSAIGFGLAAGVGLLNNSSFADQDMPINEDGLHIQPWFLQNSFLELSDDTDTAGASNKHLAIMWELKGCPYCTETHKVNLQIPEIKEYLSANFDILQLNVIGSKITTDFDGEELSEKALGAKYGIKFTPTFTFYPKSSEGLAQAEPMKREIARLPGYIKPPHFLAMFKYIGEEQYKTQSFREYLKQNPVSI